MATETSPNSNDLNDIEDCDLSDDLSAINIATCIEQNLAGDDSNIIIPDNQSEACKKILIVCSNTAQDIKKSISSTLTQRESAVISDDDPSRQLQASLNQRIADFERTVTSCLSTQPPNIDTDFQITEIIDDQVDPTVDVDAAKDNSTVICKDESKSVINRDLKVCDEKVEKSCDVITVGSPPVIKSEHKASSSYSVQEQKTTKGLMKNQEKNTQKQITSSKKKIEKNVDTIMKSLASYSSFEEKLLALCKKHAESLEEQRVAEPILKQLERQVVKQQKEKEVLQAEHNRTILAKSRLESLCREMQKQNKAIKEESLQRIREEEEKRKEVANKFQATLNDISSLMQENSKKNIQLRDENSGLALKLKGLVENYEVWEQNMQKILQQKELEAQLAKAKHAKINLLLKQETEKFLNEKKSLLENQNDLQKRCTQLAQNELTLRTELADYISKYEEFQSVLTNSSKVFTTFKNDMDATSKKIKKLEKETNAYKQKWESSNNALLEMISFKEKSDKEFANSQQRVATLEKLCRALQAERTELRNKLNAFTTSETTVTENEKSSTSEE